jgi:hypothetical protein
MLAGWRAGPLELLVGPFLSPYAVGGASQHTGVLFGGGATARLTPSLSPRLRLVVGVRVDGYANRIHASWTGQTGFATPRVGGAIAIGVAWNLGT